MYKLAITNACTITCTKITCTNQQTNQVNTDFAFSTGKIYIWTLGCER